MSGALWHGYKVAGGHQTLQLGMRGEEGEGGGGEEDRRRRSPIAQSSIPSIPSKK